MPIEGVQWVFKAPFVAGAPEMGGVYGLWKDGELIYLGSARGGDTTIKSQLSDHLSGRAGSCTRDATHYSWEICADPLRREAELISEFRAEHGRSPRCHRQQV